MVYLKQLMQNGQVHIPYDRELINQLNMEQYEMMKTGEIRFDHPAGTHDDKVWAFALAVYASRPEVQEYRGTVIRGKSRRLMIGLPRKGSWEEKFRTHCCKHSIFRVSEYEYSACSLARSAIAASLFIFSIGGIVSWAGEEGPIHKVGVGIELSAVGTRAFGAALASSSC